MIGGRTRQFSRGARYWSFGFPAGLERDRSLGVLTVEALERFERQPLDVACVAGCAKLLVIGDSLAAPAV